MPVLSRKKSAVAMRKHRKKLRAELLQIIGGRCVDCGATEDLEPDHLTPRTWQSRDVWSSSRIKRYIDEAKAGLVVCRCKKHNRERGQPRWSEDDLTF